MCSRKRRERERPTIRYSQMMKALTAWEVIHGRASEGDTISLRRR
jgi:hypothetical protein